MKDVVQELLAQTEYRQIVAWVIDYYYTSDFKGLNFLAFIIPERVYVSSVAFTIKKTQENYSITLKPPFIAGTHDLSDIIVRFCVD